LTWNCVAAYGQPTPLGNCLLLSSSLLLTRPACHPFNLRGHTYREARAWKMRPFRTGWVEVKISGVAHCPLPPPLDNSPVEKQQQNGTAASWMSLLQAASRLRLLLVSTSCLTSKLLLRHNVRIKPHYQFPQPSGHNRSTSLGLRTTVASCNRVVILQSASETGACYNLRPRALHRCCRWVRIIRLRQTLREWAAV
jgi:hypothetical protein